MSSPSPPPLNSSKTFKKIDILVCIFMDIYHTGYKYVVKVLNVLRGVDLKKTNKNKLGLSSARLEQAS